jgi:hypothetical protein
MFAMPSACCGATPRSPPPPLTLGLGIGLTASIFSVVQAVLLQPVPFPDADRLLMVWQTDRNADTVREPASVPDFIDVANRSRQLDRFGAFASYDANSTPPAGDPVRVSALAATPGLFTLLGIRPVAGRLCSEAEDRVGGPPVALISDALWARLFDRAPAAIGRSLRLNGRELTVVGVVPQSADFGVLQILSSAAYGRGFADRDARTRVEVWTPLQSDESNASRDSHAAQGLALTAVGLVVGVAVALASARSLSGLLFEVTPSDGTTLGGVVVVLGLVAAVSIWLPARRAVRIDPLVALRAE